MSHSKRLCCALIGGFLAAVGFLAFAAAPASQPAAQNGAHLKFTLDQKDNNKPVTVTVSGKIVQAGTGRPIPGARVRGHIVVWLYQGPEMFDRCPSAETKTDESGVYQLSFTSPLTSSGPMKGKDSIVIDAGAAGYETRPLYVRPTPTSRQFQYRDINVELKPGARLTGTILDADGQPLAGAIVHPQNGWNGDWAFFKSLGQATTDQEGHFELWVSTDKEVISERPWLQVEKAGYGALYLWDFLGKGDLGRVTVPRGSAFAGKVIGADGLGLAGCDVVARDGWGTYDRVKSAADGSYTLNGLPTKDQRSAFVQIKNRAVFAELLKADVYIRPVPGAPLSRTLRYQVPLVNERLAKGPDINLAAIGGVSGKLLPSMTALPLAGVPVRLDYDWDNMVEADAQGNFRFEAVSPGKHRLTAYLPSNLRGDTGIGSVEVNVVAGKSTENVAIQLQALAELRVQFLDAKGSPLEGITVGGTASANGDGFWTEGSISDKDGQAVLYLYPRLTQYVRGFDNSGKLVAQAAEKIMPLLPVVMENIRITMVAPAAITGTLTAEDKGAVAGQEFICQLHYADGMEVARRIKTDASGKFKLDGLQPGVVKMTVQSQRPDFTGTSAELVEIKSGVTTAIDVALQKVKL